MTQSRHVAVIGVGNEFRHDDGVGWAVIARLRERAGERGRERPLPPGTTLATCDGDPGRLIGLWDGAALAVVVDAAHAHPGTPGRVHRLALDRGRLAPPSATSSHGLGLGEAVELARILDRLPEHLIVYAVEGADGSFGEGLSPAVAAAVPAVARSVENDLARATGRRP
ncbi:hydrogenase maturation protease [Streptomyces niveiscabiei]|uniref:hydrogenase maturation protease n=1 Tax=Streptomyces niveiscabiei TaxID=164115 RepID=UPI0029B38735|nr:hydrogenase maturation protease [Streptomyces niveiscabiei]MDX3387212.1 hydrogenase maturation protease [Streptomyces niveiscabiei]